MLNVSSSNYLTKPFLQCESQDNSTQYIIEKITSIGSASYNQIQIYGQGVSERHARIEVINNTYRIKDLQSKKGTYVNGTRIIDAILVNGDAVQLGKYSFRFIEPLKKSTEIQESKNKTWNKTLNSIPHFAKSDFPVLVLGESGCGKEKITELLHKYSQRDHGPLVSVNCSALSESLIESELFGHIKGSFTGALCDRKGAFQAAKGGTLFLDEIGDLSPNLQPKLLRALENNEIKPLGSDMVIKTDVRIIAATHKNLDDLVVRGDFRADLFYRLNVIKIEIPPLRDRMEDFEHFLYQFCKSERVSFSHFAIEKLKKYSWPGNIRELKNLVCRAKASGNSRIESEDLDMFLNTNESLIVPPSNYSDQEPADEGMSQVLKIKDIERDLIIARLIKNKGNQKLTANELGLPKSTLHDRIKAMGINLTKIKQM